MPQRQRQARRHRHAPHRLRLARSRRTPIGSEDLAADMAPLMAYCIEQFRPRTLHVREQLPPSTRYPTPTTLCTMRSSACPRPIRPASAPPCSTTRRCGSTASTSSVNGTQSRARAASRSRPPSPPRGPARIGGVWRTMKRRTRRSRRMRRDAMADLEAHQTRGGAGQSHAGRHGPRRRRVRRPGPRKLPDPRRPRSLRHQGPLGSPWPRLGPETCSSST